MAAVLAAAGAAKIYSATYSNVPVYEFKLGTDSVMRRRSDDWINATHILKVAGLDKPSRTRILEREVQRGVHEKIQGGYGKYQGTWVPMEVAQELAERNQITDRLQPIFDFVPGDQSPPPAPKHTNAVSSRPRSQKLAAAAKRQPPPQPHPVGVRDSEQPASSFMSAPSVSFSQEQQRYPYDEHDGDGDGNDDDSMAQAHLESSSMVVDDDATMLPPGSQHTASRKRKRGPTQDPALSIIEQNHIIYGDQLLDYFMTVGDAPTAARVQPPVPPPQFQVDRAIDDQGNTALHWACAMGDLDIVRDLIDRGANVHCLSHHDETPLVRAVLFTNNYEKRTMHEMAELLKHTITFRDWFGATVFNHLAATTRSKGKWKSSRYYAQTLIDKLTEMFPRHEIILLLSSQDSNGDTAALTAAKNGCHKLATTLLSHCPEAGDLQNKAGETANDVLMDLSRQFHEQQSANNNADPRRQHHHHPQQQHGTIQDPNDDRSNHFSHLSNHFPQPSSDTAISLSRPSYQSHRHQLSSQQQQQNPDRTSEATAALLERVGAIMDEANRRLARAYGEVKSTNPADGDSTDIIADGDAEAPDGGLNINHGDADMQDTNSKGVDNDDPKTVWTRIESERESLRDQIQKLSSRETSQTEPLETLRERYATIRERYASLLSQTQRSELRRRFSEHKAQTQEQSEDGTPNGTAASDPAQTYSLASSLLTHHRTHTSLTSELITQRANAGASARMDVHRKLVALATGVDESDLDPMAEGLAEALEFERGGRNGNNGNSNSNLRSTNDGDAVNLDVDGNVGMRIEEPMEEPVMDADAVDGNGNGNGNGDQALET